MARLGLALGGGVARGLAHIGVLKALEALHIRPDLIAGTSMGAVIGAVYACGVNAREMEETGLSLNWGRRALLIDLAVPRTGLIRGERIKTFLAKVIGDVQFSDLRTPFACVATDLMTGGAVVMDKGPVVEAVRASISVPGIFTPVDWHGRILIDGGLSVPVPVGILKRKGAEVVVAVNVMPSARRSRISRARDKRRKPNIFDIILQTFYITSYQRVRANLRGADIVIEPRVEDIGFGDFHKIKECISLGEEATHLALKDTPLAQAGYSQMG